MPDYCLAAAAGAKDLSALDHPQTMRSMRSIAQSTARSPTSVPRQAAAKTCSVHSTSVIFHLPSCVHGLMQVEPAEASDGLGRCLIQLL